MSECEAEGQYRADMLRLQEWRVKRLLMRTPGGLQCRAAPLLGRCENPTDEMRTGAQLRAPTHWSAAVFKVAIRHSC